MTLFKWVGTWPLLQSQLAGEQLTTRTYFIDWLSPERAWRFSRPLCDRFALLLAAVYLNQESP